MTFSIRQNGSALRFVSEDLKLAFIKEFNEPSTTLGNLVPDDLGIMIIII